MALHTTNYTNTFIAVADDCPVQAAEAPVPKAAPTVASMQYALLHEAPYRYTSDEVLFAVHALRQGIPASEQAEARAAFFSKGQACMRASPLAKRHGFGMHHDAEGRIALVPLGTDAYARMQQDSGLKQVKAMRSKRA